MFKLLEKSPFVRWKFVQRIVHKHRTSKRSDDSKYKTFSNAQTSNQPAKSEPSSKESPFYARRRLDKANEDLGITTEASGFTDMHREVSARPLRRSHSDETLGIVADSDNSEEEIDTSEYTPHGYEGCAAARPSTAAASASANHIPLDIGGHLTANQPVNAKIQYNPLSYHRSSKLRNSFRQFKSRSMSHLDSARKSVRRRVTTRKYDNLSSSQDTPDTDEMVNYDRSPGFKRRQIGQSFRRSMRRSGKYVLAGIQQLPGVAIAGGMNTASSLFQAK